ncbi:MAG: hypothetical protein KIT10_01425 [Flavobacteriales bacterium]|nr:hypothetical protein [Flavobacteriales bacterium]
MKSLLHTLTASLLLSVSQAQDPIIYTVDLTDQRNDQLSIRVDLPALDREVVTFAFPRMVPGIYGAMEHGRLVHAVSAFDEEGYPMAVRKVDVNTYVIEEGRALRTLTYAVDDGWEEFAPLYQYGSYRSSEGTVKRDAQVINHNALFGYVVGEERRPVEVRMTHAPTHFPATGLTSTAKAPGSTVLTARDYRHLVDNPMLIADPDTVHLLIGNTKVLVACHSTTGQPIARMISEQAKPLLRDQFAYLRALPLERYTLLIYHHPNREEGNYQADGLEHASSTLILLCLPLEAEMLGGVVSDIISHEVFHTLLPIHLHGEEIAHYDWSDPQVGSHLWLYEGMTEYFAMHMPVKQGRATVQEFLATLEEKTKKMSGFPDDEALTLLSRDAVTRQDAYPNFYQKGALFCMLLDIELRALSKGRYGAVDLCTDMARVYGPDKPFKDDALFAELARVSGLPSIEGFLRDHLDRPVKLDVAKQLARAGIVRDATNGGYRSDPKATGEQQKLRKAWLGR